MSSISSIDTALYAGLIESLQPASTRSVVPYAASEQQPGQTQATPETVDLSHYYDNLESGDLITKIGQNLAQSAEALDSAMVSAIENGFSVQDACNIHAAKAAYMANCAVFDMATDVSTFELSV
ncbi:hypothetical protein IJD34_07200 [bacterium]|nr:hypothetical protein [bacterium]